MNQPPVLTGTITEKQFWYILRLKRNIDLFYQFMKHEDLLEAMKNEYGDLTSMSREKATEVINQLRPRSDFVTRKVCAQSGFPIALIHPGQIIQPKEEDQNDLTEQLQRWEKALKKIQKEKRDEVDA
jgi:hypothetical protein